jgi:hypothetical protein
MTRRTYFNRAPASSLRRAVEIAEEAIRPWPDSGAEGKGASK